MSPETLITILSFAIAIYALMPRERVLDLKIKLAWYDWCVLFGSIVVVHYIFYFPQLNAYGLTFNLGTWRWGFDPSTTTYTIIFGTALWLGARLRFGGLRRRRIGAFSELATNLLHRRKYGELAELLERYLPQLMKIYNNGFIVSRIRDWLSPPTWLALTKARKRRPKALRVIGHGLGAILPRFERSQNAARQVVRRIILFDPFVEELARAYPYQSLEILRHDLQEMEGFQEKLFRALLDDRFSVLYAEITHNQSMQMPAYHRYEYRPANALLWFYFNDVRVAEKLHAYKAFGDYLTAAYNMRLRNPQNDRFNQPLDRYADSEIWRCPAYAVLRLFDYMISESLYQGVSWHMWLHYLQTFSEKIVQNLSPSEDVNFEAEFPTPYHYQLYEIVTSFCEWTASATDLPDYESAQVRDRAIPMQSITALARTLNVIVLAPNLDHRFKAYMLEVALGRADDWRNNDKLEPYRAALVSNVAAGGRDWGVPTGWADTLRSLLRSFDHARHHRIVADMHQALDERWN